jgi:hypothetical protein
MERRIHKIRLLGPTLYKGTSVKQLQFLELDRILWDATSIEKPINSMKSLIISNNVIERLLEDGFDGLFHQDLVKWAEDGREAGCRNLFIHLNLPVFGLFHLREN